MFIVTMGLVINRLTVKMNRVFLQLVKKSRPLYHIGKRMIAFIFVVSVKTISLKIIMLRDQTTVLFQTVFSRINVHINKGKKESKRL
jgi:hypothetical protein